MRVNHFRLRRRKNVFLLFGKMSLHTKFDKNQTKNGSVITDTVAKKMPMHVTMSNFVKIGQTVAEISRFNCFTKWRPPSYWIFKF